MTAPSANRTRLPGSLSHLRHRVRSEVRAVRERLQAEHKQLQLTQAKLRISQRQYADLFEYASVGYVTLDASGRIRRLNKAGALLLGSTPKILRGTSFAAHVSPRDEARFWKYLDLCLASTQREVIALTVGRRLATPTDVQLSTTATAETDGHGPELHITIIDLTELKHAQTALQRANDQLEFRVQKRTAELIQANENLSSQISRGNHLEAELLEISEREKRLFGQDLHDETCQSLAGLSLLARVIAREMADGPQPLKTKVEALSTQLRSLVEQTRNIARGLHPVALSGGLAPALRELAERVGEKTRCILDVDKEVVVSEAEALALYRIAQEAVQNAMKHAIASCIRISLRREERHLLLAIEDNGVGLPPSDDIRSTARGMGFDIMGCRARSVKAQLVVERLQAGGTRVACLLALTDSSKAFRGKLARKRQSAV